MSSIKIIETGIAWGNMNTAPRFYPENWTREDRTNDFLMRRIDLGDTYGFDGHKMFMVDQVNKNGSYHIFTSEDVINNPNGWGDYNEDIGIISSDYSRGIVVGHPVADCPVVIVTDVFNGVSAIAHCSAELINIHMPALTVEALKKASKELGKEAKETNYFAYISSCAGANWEYDCYPKWATNEEVWKDHIRENENKKGFFNIDIRKATIEQLNKSGLSIGQIKTSDIDTITSPLFYSNSASYQDPTKAGRNFMGAFYQEPVLTKKKSR